MTELGKVDAGPDSLDLERGDDLFERCVAGSLADAVDRALDLRRSGGDSREAVRHRQTEIVVAVCRQPSADTNYSKEPGVFLRHGITDRVGDVEDVCARVDRGGADLGEEGVLGACCVLRAELELVVPRPRMPENSPGE